MLKNLAFLVAGAALGYILTRQLYAKKLDEHYSAMAMEEIEEAEKHYLRLEEELRKHYETASQEIPTVSKTVIVEKVTVPPAELLKSTNVSGEQLVKSAEAAFMDYSALSTVKKSSRTETPEQTEDPAKEESMPESPVELISEAVFEAGELGYDQTTVIFYAEDRVLADENDKVLDIDKAFGTMNDDWFGAQSTDPNTCHLRSDSRELDFEVVRENGSFTKLILGQGE